MTLFAAALFGVVLQLDLADGLADRDEVGDRAMRWRAAGLAFAIGVLASVTYLVSVWLIDRIDRAAVVWSWQHAAHRVTWGQHYKPGFTAQP
jgi:hypothetical protein